MKVIKEINFESVTEAEFKTYKIRDASRGVIFDQDGKIALMRVNKDNFHKLPGGGIDNGENPEEALKRECREEAGVILKDITEIGLVREIKKFDNAIQNSYFYTAKVSGDKFPSNFTLKEIDRGFELLWVEIDEAIHLVENDGGNFFGKYIKERELTVLKIAKDLINKK